MPNTVRNSYYKNLTYEKLMEAHIKSKKGKGYRNEIIKFNLKQEEYIIWLLEQLKTKEIQTWRLYNFLCNRAKIKKNRKIKIYRQNSS